MVEVVIDLDHFFVFGSKSFVPCAFRHVMLQIVNDFEYYLSHLW